MLDGAFTSPKLRRLAVILDVPWPHALGLAGLLWRFTAKHAPSGEIGRHDDEEIAAALEWPGTDRELIEALVRCRLLDQINGPARLLVHDWPDHAPRYVLATLKRRGLDYSQHYTEEHAVTAVETTVLTTVETTSSSTSTLSTTLPSSSPLSSSRMVDLSEGIWKMWVPGRKTGKKEAFDAIKKAIKRIAKDFGVTEETAAAEIAKRTRRDAERYLQLLETGQTELKYVPQGVTYFRKERWIDDDPEPDPTPSQDERIDGDLDRIRGTHLEQ
jgi:hypothetical protein